MNNFVNQVAAYNNINKDENNGSMGDGGSGN